MLKKNYKKILAFILSLTFLLPTLIFAESSATTIKNPLTSNDLNVILISIMNLVASVGAVIVVFFIIYSGYKFVTAGSSDSDRTKAKEMFYGTIIGGAILLGADVIANVVVNTVKATTGAK